MTKEELEKALKCVKEKRIANIGCEWCGSKDWIVEEHFVEIVRHLDNRHKYPSILIICVNCGNSKLFNAIISDVKEVSSISPELPVDSKTLWGSIRHWFRELIWKH
jgi:hypothetical protein